MGKSYQKVRKTKHTSVRKSYSTSIACCKKTEKSSKSKTTTLTYSDNLKKNQQDQGGKNWYYTQILPLKISNLRIKLLK